MSEINTEQDNKKEQALETTQKIKKPEGLEPASSDLPALLAVLSVLVVVFFISMIFQNAPTATTSKSQQSAKASASACPDGYEFASNVYSAQDFVEGTIDDDVYLVVGWLTHADWYRNTADLCMDPACQGPSETVFLNLRNASLFHETYVQHRTMGNWAAIIIIRNGKVIDLVPQYYAGRQIWMRTGEHGICYLEK
ncbi:hypothetical protein [Candidatus Avelusimicrobium fimicolum]|uniref:hypothetical protein n=1 Tax=Candidatus Avelusimicrobium fimicolum TaxID=3416216 RepID=UPI003D0A35E5